MNENILIVDDNVKILENMAELLVLAGYRVITADSGIKGLDLVRSNHPDLILCDIMMPDLDGYGMLRVVQNIPEMTGVPFIFVTAKSDKADFRKGMDMGSDDYLTKPFTGDDLLRAVEARLKKSLMVKGKNKSNSEEFTSFNSNIREIYNITTLLENRSIKRLKRKDMVFSKEDSPFYLYFLVSGKIKTIKTNDLGKEYITQIYQKGDFFGYTALLKDSKYNETAIAIENSEVTLIPRQDFFQLLHSNNEMSAKFIRLISNNLSSVEERLIKLAYGSARKRMMDALLFIYRKYNIDKKENFSFPAHRENISAIAGISPESVSRNLTDFKEEGLIETDNKMIKIIDIKKFENGKY